MREFYFSRGQKLLFAAISIAIAALLGIGVYFAMERQEREEACEAASREVQLPGQGISANEARCMDQL